MRTAMIVVLAALVSGAAQAEKWGPTWSEVTGARYTRATMHRMPAIVKSIDGRDTTGQIVKVESGKHMIRLQSPMRKGFSGTDRQMELVLEPCKRYYINAQFESATGTEWEPVIDQSIKIAGCKLTPAK